MSIAPVPKHFLLFETAGSLAAAWYEVGRSQGLKSKWPNARLYAKNNLEKFVPKAIEYFITMLGNPTFPDIAKKEIYDALMEAHSDPKLKTGNELPDIDVKKILNNIDAGPAQTGNLNLVSMIEKAVKDNTEYLKKKAN